jgi:glycosyltransferase involved in cell wall biosynthesis
MRTPDQLPPIDVIIPVWNRPEEIATCLAAIARQTYPRELTHVYVVDNGSTDETPEVVRSFPWANLVFEPQPGSYSARNAGLRASVSPYVAFTDSDCLPEPDWLASGVAALLDNPGVGVVGGHIRLFQSAVDAEARVAHFEQLYALNQQRMTAGNGCMTANWFSPRTVLEEAGGFDERLKSTADSELSQRIGRHFPVIFAPEAVVAHPARATCADLLGKERRTIGGRWQKYVGMSRLAWRRMLAIELAARTKRALLCELALREKLAVMALNVQVYFTQLSELRRLEQGGEPARE